MEQKSLKYLKWGFVCLFFHLKIGGIDFLPDFVGALLIFSALQSYRQATDAEERIKSLFLVLAADYFLHWIFPFEFALENLLIAVISMYAMFVLLGEVANRIQDTQPERANQLNVVRVLTVISQVVNFVVSAYENDNLNAVLVLISLCIWITLLVVVCRIEPTEEKDRNSGIIDN